MNTEERDLLEQAAALPRRIEPERDLWPRIEAGLDNTDSGTFARSEPAMADADRLPRTPGQKIRWLAPLALAASLALAVGIGYWAGAGNKPAAPGPVLATTELPAPLATRPVSLEVDADLQRTRALLAADIEAALLRLPPDASAVVSENLAAINRALDQIDEVLGQAPATDLDQQLLMAMYADQIARLSGMHSVIYSSRTSNQEILL